MVFLLVCLDHLMLVFFRKVNGCLTFLFVLGTIVYNAYIDGLSKRRDSQKALSVFQRMKRENCELNADTYTMVINLFGKVIITLF